MRGAELVFSETNYWSLYQTSPCIASTLIFLPGDCFPCPVRELRFSHSSLDFTSLYLRTLLFLRCPKLKNCPPAREYTYILSLSTKHIYGHISYVYAHITYQWFSINSYRKYGWLKKNNTLFILFFFFFFFSFFDCAKWHVGSWFPNQGRNLLLLHWKSRILNTGPPGKSQLIL